MIQFRMRFPGGKIKAFTMSYDDGVEQDVKLIEIMRNNGIKVRSTSAPVNIRPRGISGLRGRFIAA